MLAQQLRSWLVVGALGAATVGCAASAPPVEAAARPVVTDDRLDVEERLALAAGHTVARPMEFEAHGGRYVGGVAYQLVETSADAVHAALSDPEALADMLPHTKSITVVDSSEEHRSLEVVQGNDLVSATYTVVVKPDADGTLRFWLDDSRPHGIEDVWGYFRTEPFDDGRTLVTVGVALDVGPGIVRLLFEKRIQEIVLSTPSRIRRVVETSAAQDTRQARAR